MSIAAKIVFTLSCAATIGIIGYVHYQQEAERKQLHLGVERDIERQKRAKLLQSNPYLKEQLEETLRNKENLQAS